MYVCVYINKFYCEPMNTYIVYLKKAFQLAQQVKKIGEIFK